MLRLSLFVYLSFVLSSIAFSQGRPETRGECPNAAGIITTCEFNPRIHCISQNQCPNGYKCCPYGCSSLCLAVTKSQIHPGSCPANLTGTGKTCNRDAVCNANEKCCKRHCVVVRPFSAPVIGGEQSAS